MDIRFLEAFRAVVESGSVTHAASSLGITQPAVSAQIARLQSELGFSLFTRTGNRLRLTSEAVTFRAEVERTLDRIDDLGRAAEHIRQGQVGSLTLASHPMAGVTLLPPVIAAFVQRRPNVRVQLFTRNSDLVRVLVPSRTSDIRIARVTIAPTG